MISTKDLMIGDWVYMEAHRGYETQYIQIGAIPDASSKDHYGHIGAFPVGGDNNFQDIEDRHLFPIPLTAEILEKSEFELYGNEWQYHTEDDKGHILIEFSKDNKISINIYNSLALKDDKGRADLVHFGRDWCDSFYVHELQNAIHLCRIEHEITL